MAARHQQQQRCEEELTYERIADEEDGAHTERRERRACRLVLTAVASANP